MTVIYGLTDPRDDRVRYVGQTVLHLEDRRYQHVFEAVQMAGARSFKSPKVLWIQELLRLDYVPEVVVLQQVMHDEDHLVIEREWIAKLRATTPDLTNIASGGGHRAGHRRSSYDELCRILQRSESDPRWASKSFRERALLIRTESPA